MDVQPIESPMSAVSWVSHVVEERRLRRVCGVKQEDTMICERWRGLTVLDHFHGTAINISAWMYDGLRCINCGSIIVLMTGEGNVSRTSYGAVRSAHTMRVDRGWPLDRDEH